MNPNSHGIPTNLSHLQTHYWIGQNLRPESPLFNTILSLSIRGPVDPDIFLQAHDELVRRSDVLRTVVVEKEGVPYREVLKAMAGTLEFVDLSGEPDPKGAYQEWVAGRSVTPLKIDQRLFDSALVRLAEDHFVWYHNVHHIHTDAISGNLTWDYLSRYYRLAKDGRLAEAPDIPSFETYIEYERRQEALRASPSAVAFWDDMSRTLPDMLQPNAYPGRSRRTQPAGGEAQRVRREVLDLGEAATRKFFAIAKEKNFYSVSKEFTVTALFLSLLAVQLHEWFGVRRAGAMTTLHNRATPALQSGLGLMMLYLPLVVPVEAGDSFRSVYNRTRKTLRMAYINPPPHSAAERQSSHFEVMFNYYSVPEMDLDGSPVDHNFIQNGYGTEIVSLNVYKDAGIERLICNFDLAERVFSKEDSRAFLSHFEQLVHKVLNGGDFELQAGRRPDGPGQERGDAENRAADGHKYLPPRDIVETRLAHIWEDILQVERVSVDESFYALGGNSWNATRLFNAIGEQMDVHLPLSILLQSTTIESLANVIRRDDPEALWQETALLKEGEGAPDLYFVSGGAGNLLAVSRLARNLSAPNGLVSFEIAGYRDGDLSAIETIKIAAKTFVDALLKQQPEGPYLLGGYSWGAVVAYEMAQQLVRSGRTVPLLINVDMPLQPPYDGRLARRAAGMAKRFGWDSAREEEIYMALRDLKIAWDFWWGTVGGALREGGSARRKLVRLRNAAAGLLRHGLQLFSPQARRQNDFWLRFNLDENRLRVIRKNDRALARYLPGPFAGEMAIFYTTSPRKNPRMRSARSKLGWEKVVRGEIRMLPLEGDHLSIMDEPHVRRLAQELDVVLEKFNREREKD